MGYAIFVLECEYLFKSDSTRCTNVQKSNTTETPATTVYIKELIHVPERYEDESYRREVYERWMQEWAAASAQLADINSSPFYGQGWRVD